MNVQLNKILVFLIIYLKYIFYHLWIKDIKVNKNQSTGIVFSMDRPLQLNALLDSYFEFCEKPEPLVVIYKCTSESFHKGYLDIILHYEKKQNIIFIIEKNFKTDLLNVIKSINTKFLFF